MQRATANEQSVFEAPLLHALFEQQVSRTPHESAVIYGDAKLSFSGLEQRANQVSHWLATLSLEKNARVGIALSPSLWLHAVLLGVLKQGHSYIPIDPSFPAERIGYMIDQSQLSLLIYDDSLDADVLEILPRSQSCSLDAVCAAAITLPETRLDTQVGGEDVAYMIYTSGSTGKPKGVVIPHRAAHNFLLTMMDRPGFGAGDRILAVTTLSFDIAVTEMFLPLVAGGCSVLVDREVAKDAELLRRAIEDFDITVYQATPSSWRMLLSTAWVGSAKLSAWMGGEAMPAEVAAKALPKVAALWNCYGPTETTVYSTCQQISSVEEVKYIGTPVGNTVCRVLDDALKPVPVGEIGELCIGGIGLALGYYRRPDLTQERFIQNPLNEENASILYRTGDLVRMHENGWLEYLGRSDFQISLRGFRIELGEIEAGLVKHPAVAQAVVVARNFGTENNRDMRLIAYMVANSGFSLDMGALREHLQQFLTPYMIPQHYVQMDAMPMTPNQKVNRNALPMPEVESVQAYVAPATPTEAAVQAIWEQVMKREHIGAEDDFFALGGHSMLAVQISNAIRKQFKVNLPLASLFSHSTIRAMSTFLEEHIATPKKHHASDWSNLVALREKGAHAPFFFFHPVGGNVLHYSALLSRIPKGWPVYGLQATGLDGLSAPEADYCQMARRYLSLVRSVQPKGPYWLGGGSSGGLVAMEVARQLEEMGERVERVFLFDTVGPVAPALNGSRIEARRHKNLARQIQHSISVRLEEFARRWFCEIANRLQIELSMDLRHWWIRHRNLEAMHRYLSSHRSRQRYSGSVELFRLPEEERGRYSQPLIGWDGVLDGLVGVHLVEGDHATLIESPIFSAKFAEVMAKFS
ncbi:hypothetical protein HDN1F_05690 [gamma proteobacterium HdN1]|nr:hypothetical protein HDN1F_05690 [gamma proteobacterium HdN1]